MSAMLLAPIVFLDVETCGLALSDPIWEIAAIRRESDGAEAEHCWQVRHNLRDADKLPEPFRADRAARYSAHSALWRRETADQLREILRPGTDGKAVIVGAVPNFDTERIAYQFGVAGWSHRLRCVETLTAGHLGRDVGGLSDCAAALGIDTPAAHTALGDARTARAIWDAILGGRR